MRKIPFIVFSFFSLNLFSSEDFTFRFKGVNYQSTSNEIVYRNSTSNKKLSELIWENNSNLIGFGASINNKFIFTFNFDLYFSFDDGIGTMVDYDWLDFNTTDWTHKSKHNTKSNVFLGDLNMELKTFNFGKTKITFILGYKYDFLKSSAYGGTFTYSSPYGVTSGGGSSTNGFRNIEGSLADNVKGVSYSQYFSVPYIGIDKKFGDDSYMIETKLIYTNQVRAEGEDIHHLRDLVSTFYSEGSLLSLELLLSCKLSNNIFLKGTFKYDKYNLNRAYLTQTFNEEDLTFAGYGAGMEEESKLFALGLEYEI